MKLPQVGSIVHVGREFDMKIVSGSNAKTAHIDPDLSLVIISNGEEGPLMKVVNPIYFGAPVSQFSSKLVLGMTFKELLHIKNRKATRAT